MSHSSPFTIYPARKIITMNPALPTASHVAVRGDRILGVGTLDELTGWGPHQIDDRFANHVLMPGLVEGHCHIMEGGLWQYTYTGYYDRAAPDGSIQTGSSSINAVIERLQKVAATMTDPNAPLLAWGFDPIYFEGTRMTREHLDQIDANRPILILHASAHLVNVNTAVLKAAGIDGKAKVDGVVMGQDGYPTGELQEAPAMFPAFEVIGADFFHMGESKVAMENFALNACQAGVTTATDLYNEYSQAEMENFSAACNRDDFPLRMVPAFAGLGCSVEEGLQRMEKAKQYASNKLHLGIVKLFTDGSIQGFTGRLKEPGYYNGSDNGLWMVPPEQFREQLAGYHKAGATVHIHTNGDEASELALDAIESTLAQTPRYDHRHTLQHCQVAPADQFRRMSALGVCANLFTNHLFYWGDQHLQKTLGPERTKRMNACATALHYGVPLAMHSDAPITPLAPLFTAWCAVNRLSASGQVLGEEERISVAAALQAITIGAAYTLKLDHLIGSIEAGKMADFAVLEDDPLEVDADKLKDVRVWGTVVGGHVFPARS